MFVLLKTGSADNTGPPTCRYCVQVSSYSTSDEEKAKLNAAFCKALSQQIHKLTGTEPRLKKYNDVTESYQWAIFYK